jgi:hypothetical protein
MSPIVILFHTAFQWGNQLASTTYFSVVTVVATGLVGRWIYGWMRLDADTAAEADRLGKSLSELVKKVPAELLERAHGRAGGKNLALEHVLGIAKGKETAQPRSLFGLFARMPGDSLRVSRGLRGARRLFLERSTHRSFCADVRQLRRLRTKVFFHRKFKRLMSGWRSFHIVLAVVLLALIGLHVWVSLRLGFRWLWA